jgi:hypothetical protein
MEAIRNGIRPAGAGLQSNAQPAPRAQLDGHAATLAPFAYLPVIDGLGSDPSARPSLRTIDRLHRPGRRPDGGCAHFALGVKADYRRGVVPLVSVPCGLASVATASVLARIESAIETDGSVTLQSLLRPRESRDYRASREARKDGMAILSHAWRRFGADAPAPVRQAAMRAHLTPFDGLPAPLPTNSNVEYLNWCAVDLDVGHDAPDDGEAAGAAMGHVVAMVHRGELPDPSAFIYSGRGLWVLWALVDHRNPVEAGEKRRVRAADGTWREHEPDTAVLVDGPDTLRLHRLVQATIVQRLSHLNADKAAINAARWAPAPNVFRASVGRRAIWLPFHDAARPGQVPAYTLAQLATVFGVGADVEWLSPVEARGGPVLAHSNAPHAVEAPVGPRMPWALRPYEPKGGTPPAVRERKRRGWHGRGRAVVLDLEAVLSLRGGGVDEGLRELCAYQLAMSLRMAGWAPHAIEDRLTRFAAACRPPMPGEDVRKALASTWRGSVARFKYATIRDVWALTSAELDVCQAIKRDTTVRRPKRRPPAERHARILAIIAEAGGAVPPLGELAAQLQREGFGDVLVSSVSQDYKRLGVVAPRGRLSHQTHRDQPSAPRRQSGAA